MTIDELKQQIDELKKTYEGDIPSDELTLRDQIILTYRQAVLNELSKLFDEHKDAQLTDALCDFLTHNWKCIQNSMCSYTALRNRDITQLLCAVANFVASEKQISPIEALMPTVCIEHLDGSEKDLKNFPLEKILKTHIVGRDGNYLIPVELLVDINAQNKIDSLPNPYYDYRKHNPEMAILGKHELARLFEHSLKTKEIHTAKEHYDTLAHDASNLLGQINILNKALRYNSVNGVGTEKIAGKSVDRAIQNFLTFYDQLGEQRNRIPSAVREEIELLSDYFTGKKTTDIGSCIAIRRGALHNAAYTNNNDQQLSKISLQRLSKKDKEKLLTDAKNALTETTSALRSALNKNTYDNGHDKLLITKKILDRLQVKFSPKKPEDVYALQSLSAEEIENICEDKKTVRQIIHAVKKLEELVMLFHHLAPEQLTVLLPYLLPYIQSNQQRARNLAQVLDIDILTPEKQKIILDTVDFGKLYQHQFWFFENLFNRLSEAERKQYLTFRIDTAQMKLFKEVKFKSNILLQWIGKEQFKQISSFSSTLEDSAIHCYHRMQLISKVNFLTSFYEKNKKDRRLSAVDSITHFNEMLDYLQLCDKEFIKPCLEKHFEKHVTSMSQVREIAHYIDSLALKEKEKEALYLKVIEKALHTITSFEDYIAFSRLQEQLFSSTIKSVDLEAKLNEKLLELIDNDLNELPLIINSFFGSKLEGFLNKLLNKKNADFFLSNEMRRLLSNPTISRQNKGILSHFIVDNFADEVIQKTANHGELPLLIDGNHADILLERIRLQLIASRYSEAKENRLYQLKINLAAGLIVSKLNEYIGLKTYPEENSTNIDDKKVLFALRLKSEIHANNLTVPELYQKILRYKEESTTMVSAYNKKLSTFFKKNNDIGDRLGECAELLKKYYPYLSESKYQLSLT